METKQVEPYVILRSSGAVEDALDGLGVGHEVLRFPSTIRSDRIPDWIKVASFPYYERKIAGAIRAGHFDIVHNNGIMYDLGLRAAQRLGVPCVCHVREYAQPENGIELIDRKRLRRTVSRCDQVIFISHGVAERFDGWAAEGKGTVLYDGFDVSRYHREHAPILSGAIYRMVLAGHIMPQKGQLVAAKAACELHNRGYDVRLTVAGLVKDEEYFQSIVKFVEANDAGSYVRLIDFVDDLSAIRAKCDISLMCSTADEGLGRITVEGMLAGCLAVGSNVAGVSEVITDGETGLLYEANDYTSLADCVEHAIKHSDDMRSIASRGQCFALDTFNSGEYAERLMAIYSRVLTTAETTRRHDG